MSRAESYVIDRAGGGGRGSGQYKNNLATPLMNINEFYILDVTVILN